MDLRRPQEERISSSWRFRPLLRKSRGKGSGNGTGAWARSGVKKIVFVARGRHLETAQSLFTKPGIERAFACNDLGTRLYLKPT
jgi:hypothetical protein